MAHDSPKSMIQRVFHQHTLAVILDYFWNSRRRVILKSTNATSLIFCSKVGSHEHLVENVSEQLNPCLAHPNVDVAHDNTEQRVSAYVLAESHLKALS